jgi:LysR family transcriptional regulator of abg operon
MVSDREARDDEPVAPGGIAALDPSALVLLAEIADAGSVTAAARVLGCTQPALSKQLRRLEQAQGAPLFERGVRGVQPTAEGHALLPRARAIRAQARMAAQDMQQRRGLREGRLVVALSHFATITLLPRVVPAFHARWPGVQLSIIPPTFQLGGLREGEPDFAVMSLPAERLGAEFSARSIFATNVAVVVRAGHPLAQATSLAATRDADWLLPSLESSVTRGLQRAFRQARLGTPRCLVTCQTLTGFELLARHSDLVAAVPVEVYEARAATSDLVRVPLADTIEGPRVAVLRWADSRPTPASADLEEAFVAAAYQMARTQGARSKRT